MIDSRIKEAAEYLSDVDRHGDVKITANKKGVVLFRADMTRSGFSGWSKTYSWVQIETAVPNVLICGIDEMLGRSA